MTSVFRMSWRSLASVLIVSMTTIVIVSCGMLDPATPPNPAAVHQTTDPTTGTTAPTDTKGSVMLDTAAANVRTYAVPVAETLQATTGYPVGTVVLGLTNLLTLGAGVIRDIAARRRAYALKEIHRDSTAGAPALTTDPRAKAIIADVTGV